MSSKSDPCETHEPPLTGTDQRFEFRKNYCAKLVLYSGKSVLIKHLK